MPVRSFVGIVVVVLVCSGCSLLHPWATDRSFHGTYDQVFQATLEARDLPLKTVDREEGRIETEKRPVGAVHPHQPVEIVRGYVERKGGEEVSVQLFLAFFESRPGLPSAPAGNGAELQSSAGSAIDKSMVYDDYLDAIAMLVKELRGKGSS